MKSVRKMTFFSHDEFGGALKRQDNTLVPFLIMRREMKNSSMVTAPSTGLFQPFYQETF